MSCSTCKDSEIVEVSVTELQLIIFTEEIKWQTLEDQLVFITFGFSLFFFFNRRTKTDIEFNVVDKLNSTSSKWKKKTVEVVYFFTEVMLFTIPMEDD